jgi:hypothetical protein
MRSNGIQAKFGSILLHHVPDRSLGNAMAPAHPGSANAPKQLPAAKFGRTNPDV